MGEDLPGRVGAPDFALLFFSPDDVVGKRVVIVSNLKARKMAGTASEGMLLCASKRDGEEEELSALDLVEAPEGASLGERVVVEVADEEHGDAAPPNKVGKKKLYEKVPRPKPPTWLCPTWVLSAKKQSHQG
eukprot:Skav215918  [mRNA]  locus=scaffold226:106564:115560:+ [translate_table: standard]